MGVTASGVGKQWKWRCRFYYHDGRLAIETVHKDDHSKDIEVLAGEARDDIGRIEVTNLWE